MSFLLVSRIQRARMLTDTKQKYDANTTIFGTPCLQDRSPQREGRHLGLTASATMNSWKHDAEGEAELERSGTLELARQDLCSFFPLKKEHLSALRRSWDSGNCRDGDNCGWEMPTISAAGTLRVGGRKDRRHLLLWHLLFGFGVPESAAFATVGLGRGGRVGNEVSTSRFQTLVST
jgi:hypothetical protein